MYNLKKPIIMGEKTIDQVEVVDMTVEALYGFKKLSDLENLSPAEAVTLVGAITGLQEPVIKKMSIGDFRFLLEKASQELTGNQT